MDRTQKIGWIIIIVGLILFFALITMARIKLNTKYAIVCNELEKDAEEYIGWDANGKYEVNCKYRLEDGTIRVNGVAYNVVAQTLQKWEENK